MITTLVQFNLPEPLTNDNARDVFLQSAPRYREAQGLIRKYYILDEDGTRAGGVYLWSSMEFAKQFYSQEWKTFIIAKYGVSPSITYFYTPVIVDNVVNEIISD